MTMALAAVNCLQAGLGPIPIKAGTKKASIKWEPFQTKRMTSAEISRLFVKGCNVALVGGAVSGNLECLDFDKPDLFKPYSDTLESVNPELRAKLRVWQETPSGGYHILFRCAGRVGASFDTWQRWREDFPELKEAYDQARAVEHDQLVGVLFEKAMAGDSTAAMFLLKCRHNYRDGGITIEDNRSVRIGVMLPASLNPEQYKQIVNAKQEVIE